MWRSHLDRRTTFGEWRKRSAADADLAPGRFRKGRRARGCPRYCIYCRLRKLEQPRRELLADMALREWTAEAFE